MKKLLFVMLLLGSTVLSFGGDTPPYHIQLKILSGQGSFGPTTVPLVIITPDKSLSIDKVEMNGGSCRMSSIYYKNLKKKLKVNRPYKFGFNAGCKPSRLIIHIDGLTYTYNL